MQIALELLAPAKNKDIGTAAVSCGADAVYMAGSAFGAREAAGNSMDDVAETVRFAHRFGARIYLTVNTILYDKEITEAEAMIRDAVSAGVDALIVQDLAVLKMDIPPVPLFASTQCDIRTPERAELLESLGFERLILARELSLEQIGVIRNAVRCDLESFVHGALCVSYSGQCYLSRRLTGRSANRGECAQVCRSLYDLEDKNGKTLLRNSSILSLKDLKLDERIPDLVSAGITSFKIEGRLKNASYVKNVVRHYRNVLDAFIAGHPDGYRKASFGKLHGGFEPDPDATFNRGHTTLFLDGKRGDWNSSDAACSVGEYMGKVSGLRRDPRSRSLSFAMPGGAAVSNGDGLMFVNAAERGTMASPLSGSFGMRADVVENGRITVKDDGRVLDGAKVYRNYNVRFERELEKNMPVRLLDVDVDYCNRKGRTILEAVCEDGTHAELSFDETACPARNPMLAESSVRRQISRTSLYYSFSLRRFDSENVYFYPASVVNGWRRRLAGSLASAKGAYCVLGSRRHAYAEHAALSGHLTYLTNCSNHLSEEVLKSLGADGIDPAYELKPVPDSLLMRTKYCIRFQLGLCPGRGGGNIPSPLYLVNNGNRIRLEFDCMNCEMLVFL
ncbi:MAG: U32 family peptidase [Bacteroidales bacterium]|jgi:putative protease|nr:U32 family peptidase [Bacteroidales bacterium]MCI2121110.1 U32 family peptidase [Bacteroidales bacterium]MCI2144925.1 U32 family peptidase [Bacteroidales bacterium]